jgi:hypothetical protein
VFDLPRGFPTSAHSHSYDLFTLPYNATFMLRLSILALFRLRLFPHRRQDKDCVAKHYDDILFKHCAHSICAVIKIYGRLSHDFIFIFSLKNILRSLNFYTTLCCYGNSIIENKPSVVYK